jgi:hypothetical protein
MPVYRPSRATSRASRVELVEGEGTALANAERLAVSDIGQEYGNLLRSRPQRLDAFRRCHATYIFGVNSSTTLPGVVKSDVRVKRYIPHNEQQWRRNGPAACGRRVFAFPEDARWNAERQTVEFRVEISEYRGVVPVPRRVFQRLLPDFLGLIVGLLSGTDGVGTSPGSRSKAGSRR